MIIPCIDLMAGKAVQLVQGERKALERDDLDALLAEFEPFPLIHVIDLDAAKGTGSNLETMAWIAAQRPVRAGGGVRTSDAAKRLLDGGVRQVIIGSSAYSDEGVDEGFLRLISEEVGCEKLIAAIDTLGGQVALHGWRRVLQVGPADVIPLMEPYVDGFLCTFVDREGMLAGTDLDLFLSLKGRTTRSLTAAGGITSLAEVRVLVENGISAALGMALYTGRLAQDDLLLLLEEARESSGGM